MHRVVGGPPPLYMACADIAPHYRKAQPGIEEPQMHLAAAAVFPELLEHQADRARHALVRINLDTPALAPAIAPEAG